MKSKLVTSIAIAMVTVVALSMLSVIPVHAVPNIYMVPNTVNGATIGLGNKLNVTVWVSGWAGVASFQVRLTIANPAAGVLISRCFVPPRTDTQFIFTSKPDSPPPTVIDPGNHSALVGDYTLPLAAANPPPDPAKLAIFELLVTGAPGKYETLSSALVISSGDTYLLDIDNLEIGVTKTDGTYSWVWVPPTTNPTVAVEFVDPGLPGATVSTGNIDFSKNYVWNGTIFVANVVIENLEVGWAISGAAFTVNYGSGITDFLGATLDPAWTGTVDTTTPGIIIVSVTTATALSGDVQVLAMTFQLKNQQSVPPAPLGTFDTSAITLTGVTLQDTVGPIPVAGITDGLVTLWAKQTFAPPSLSVEPAIVYSGHDLVIGDQFGKTFTVDVVVHDVVPFVGMVAIQFRLQYDADLVEFVSAEEGPFLAPFDNGMGTFFVAVNTINDVLFGDNVAVGDMLLPQSDGTWVIFPEGEGVVARITFAYIKQDFVTEYHMPLNLVDFSYPPPEGVYFIDFNSNEIPEGDNIGGMVVIETIDAIGRRIDVWMQYPAPFGGQGLMQPADLVVPQQIVILTAKVTYNWWPVVNKKVTFNVYDDNWNLVAVLEAITGPDGHATTSYRMPWPDVNPEGLFGVWHVYASVSVADVTVLDILSFHYDYLVEILNATTNKVSYNHLDYMAVTVTYGSHAQQMYPVWLTATLQDNLLVPVSVAFTGLSVQGAVYCQLKVYPTATLTLYVPYYAYAGAAQVRVNFLNLSPMDGLHVAVTPEYTISGIYILPV